MKFKDKLRKLRTEKGLTRKQLGELSGVSYRSIEGYEQGTREPNLENYQKLAKALEVEPFQLTETTGVYEGMLYNTQLEPLYTLVQNKNDYPEEFFTFLHDVIVVLDHKKEFELKKYGSDREFKNTAKAIREILKDLRYLIDPVPVKATYNGKTIDFTKERIKNDYSKKLIENVKALINLLNPDYFKDDPSDNYGI